MCGCPKNKNLAKQVSYQDKRAAGMLVASGEAVLVAYNGFAAQVSRRGPATNTRYNASIGDKCIPMYASDYEALKGFVVRQHGAARLEWLLCRVEQATSEQASEQVPAVEVKQAEAKQEPEASTVKTQSHIADITTMTVAEALPIIREASAHTLDAWFPQELGRQGGPRAGIMAAIAKRREEITVETGQG